MIDFHCHLDLYPNSKTILSEVAKRNIFTLCVTTSPRAWKATSYVFKDYTNIAVAIGMHPEIVKNKEKEIDLLLSYISQTKFIGEIGLDGSRNYRDTFSLQETIFKEIIKKSEQTDKKILSIHSRNATYEVLDILQRNIKSSIPVLHWFSGNTKEIELANELGCWFSVNPIMLLSKRNIEIIKLMPIDKILPETDGPFAKISSNPLMPWEAIYISEDLGKINGKSKQEIMQQLMNNCRSILSSVNVNLNGK